MISRSVAAGSARYNMLESKTAVFARRDLKIYPAGARD